MTNQDRVAIVGGARTPFAKAGTGLTGYFAHDLATSSVDGATKKLDTNATARRMRNSGWCVAHRHRHVSESSQRCPRS